MPVTGTALLYSGPHVLRIRSCMTLFPENYSRARPHPQNIRYRTSQQNHPLNQSEASPSDLLVRDCIWLQRQESKDSVCHHHCTGQTAVLVLLVPREVTVGGQCPPTVTSWHNRCCRHRRAPAPSHLHPIRVSVTAVSPHHYNSAL